MKRAERIDVRRTLLVFLLAVLSSVLLLRCSGYALVNGTVYEAPDGMRSGRAPADSAGGKPLEGVEFSLYFGKSTSATLEAQHLTNALGGYGTRLWYYSWDDKYLVTFSKKGDEPFSTIVEIPRLGEVVLDVCLAPIKEAPPQ